MNPSQPRHLVVHAHRVPESFNSALRDVIVDTLRGKVGEIGSIDLYSEGFPRSEQNLKHLPLPGSLPQIPSCLTISRHFRRPPT